MRDIIRHEILAELIVAGVVLFLFTAPAAGLMMSSSSIGFLGNTSQQADTAPTGIDSCTVIDQPGSYVLTENIEDGEADVCIDIQSSNVHFDGDGHTVDGDQTESSLSAVAQGAPPGPTNVSVGVGIGVPSALSNVTVTDVSATDSYWGVFAANVTDTVIENATASGNGAGIAFNRSTDSVVRGSMASENFAVGVFFDNSSDSMVTDTTASNNPGPGILIDSFGGRLVDNNTVTDSTTNGNGFTGIGLFNSTDNTLANNTADSNVVGIFIADDVDRTTIVDNSLVNDSFGISALDASDVVVSDNNATKSGYIGLDIHNVTGSAISGNTISDTQGVSPPFFPSSLPSSGLVLDNVTDTTVEDTTATNNSGYEFLSVNDSTDNSVEDFQMDTVTVSFESKNVAFDDVPSPPVDPEGRTNIGQYVNATNTSTDSFLDLRVSYTDEDATNIEESTLSLFEFADEEWTEIEGSSVDTDANIVSANVTDFAGENGTIYAPLGQPATDDGDDGDGATEIDSCTVIDEPGRYTLTEDLENATATEDAGIATDLGNVSACIVIDSSDVVFDGAGHTIDGKGVAPPENDTGVEQNATVNETREIFPTGVSAVSGGESLTNVTVQDVTATDWFLGVLYTNVTDSTIRDTTTNDNDNLGIEILGGATSTHVTAANNTANGNGFAGIYLGGANDNTLVNNTAAGNGLIGIDLFVSNDNSLTGNYLDDNEVAGVAVVDSTGNGLAETVISNTGGNNSFVGFSGGLALLNATDTHVEDTVATGNEEWDFYALNASATATNYTLDSTTVSFEVKNSALDAVDSPPADPENRTNIGQYVNATNTSADSFLDIDVSYGDADVEEAGVDESTLRLFEFANEEWTEVEGSLVDTDANVVSGNLTEFANESIVAPLGKTTEAPTDGEQPPSEKPTDPQQPEPGVTYYQIDFVRGEALENLDWPDGTYTNDQLIRFAHGSTDEPITRRSEGEFTTDAALAERIDSRDITVEDGTAMVTFTVADGDSVTLSLVSYTKPDPTWDPEDEDDQVFVDSETRTFESGTHTLSVDLPSENDNGADEDNGSKEANESKGTDGKISDPSASSIIQEAVRKYDSINGLSLTETTTYTIQGEAPYTDADNGSETYTQRVFAKRPNKVRYDTLVPPEYAGDVYVSNGSQTVYYNATANTYEVYDGDAGNYIEYLSDLLQDIKYEYAGTKTVDGHETYVLTNSSADSDYPSGQFELTVYLDQETYLPVKTTAVDTSLGGENSWVYTVRYENVSANPGIPDSTFEFDPPADAERIDYSDYNENYTEYDSIETAQRNVEFTIRPPTELPEGYELENVSVYTYENTTSLENESNVQIFYTNGSDVLSAYMYSLPEGSTFYGFGERVPINTQIGYFESYEGLSSVNFECDGLDYYVDGSLSMDELVAVAESVDCSVENGTPNAGDQSPDMGMETHPD